MRGLAKATAALMVATIILAGCGGGGGSSSTPHAAAPAATPASVSHTVVGTGKLTLALPKVVTAKKNGKTVAIRAVPHGAMHAQRTQTLNTKRALPAGRTRPAFVDPSPNPGNGPCPGGLNYIDIYDNGTLLPNLDGLAGGSDSLCVQQTADSTQTLNVPLYSGNSNQIVAIEWDATGNYLLSIGESDNGAISAGGSTPLNTLTMMMNAYYLGITDLGFADPEIVNGQSYGYNDFTCGGSGTSSQFALYVADGLGNFVPVAGYGGTSTPTATGSPDGGTTTLAQTTIPGVFNVGWDNSCDYITVTANASNPAYPLYVDAYEYNGAYPGIDYLYNYTGLYYTFNNQLDYQFAGPANVDFQAFAT